MKKFIFIFILIATTIFCNAQVNIETKQPEKITKVCTGYCKIYQDTNTNEYILVIFNSHPNVGAFGAVRINLGNTANDAIESLKQIEKLYEESKDGDEFVINGNRCRIQKGLIMGKIRFPKHEREYDFTDGTYYMRAYFGKLKIYHLAMDCYKNGDF